ncbi:DUF6164 family protein [Thalassolituus sp. LLYu03]|uniref:DUF6164 family protein n=1 Tax=Thalassolituus sp. LLYu03 TaxID=3421656 RepID=UPI003D275576
MAKLLFRLNQVNDDEADDVRSLLDDAGIEYYETDAGRWRISVAAIWLRHDDDFPQARALLDEYQQQRYEHVRQEYEERLSKGEVPTLWQRFQERPVDFFAVALALLMILGLMVWPFFSVGQP